MPTNEHRSEASFDCAPDGVPLGMTEGERGRWPLWEVFVRSNHGLAHKHVGSLHAADEAMALQNARDVYTRRNEGASLWIVRATDIVASDPTDRDALFCASEDKPYRHPTHYTVPDGVKNL